MDQSQIWVTDGTEFRWIWQQDYGYEPIDQRGQIVSGLTDGAIVWLVDDDSLGRGVCCQPGPPGPPGPAAGPPSPPPTPQVTVTPEPGTLLMIGAGVFILAGLYFHKESCRFTAQ